MADDDMPPGVSSDQTDHSLLARYRRGSQDAATRLYARYAQRLRALAVSQCSPDLARRVEADDLVQSVFGSFFRGADKGLYDIPPGEELWKLFLVIALNKIRAQGKRHRAAKRDVRKTRQTDWLEQPWEIADQEQAAQLTLQLTLDEAMERLTPPQREAIRLRIEGHEVSLIASQLGRSQRTVERLLQEARQRLAEYLLDEVGPDGQGAREADD